MFEKEAEKYIKKLPFVYETELVRKIVRMFCENAFKDGAKFGYNKANEWHYVKDGDLPKDNKEYLVLFCYKTKDKTRFTCGIRDNLQQDFEIHRCYTEQIIAWKEIVLPKESE